MFDTTINHPLGAHPGAIQKIRITLRGGSNLVKGDLVKLDLSASDTTSVVASTSFGGTTDPTANAIPAAAGDSGLDASAEIFAVLLEDIADDAQGFVALRGRVLASETAGGLTAGTSLSSGANELVACAAGDRCIAIAQEDTVASTPKYVFFDGVNTFGTRHA